MKNGLPLSIMWGEDELARQILPESAPLLELIPYEAPARYATASLGKVVEVWPTVARATYSAMDLAQCQWYATASGESQRKPRSGAEQLAAELERAIERCERARAELAVALADPAFECVVSNAGELSVRATFGRVDPGSPSRWYAVASGAGPTREQAIERCERARSALAAAVDSDAVSRATKHR